jgi:uncharacterized membrane protein
MPSVGLLELVTILVILALFVVPVVIVVGAIRGRPQGPAVASSDPAEDLLRRRLAQGEIDEAEYQRLRSVLRAH